MDKCKLYEFTQKLRELHTLAKELSVLGIYDFGQGQFTQPTVVVQVDSAACNNMQMNRMPFDEACKLDKRYIFVNGVQVFCLEESHAE